MHKRELIKKILFFAVVIIFLFYAFLKSLPYLIGPSVVVYEPLPNQTVGSSTFLVSGIVKRAVKLRVQGREVNIDTSGNFKELLVSHSPYTILMVEATDRYGKSKKIEFSITPSSY